MSPVDAALLKRWTDHRDAEAFNDLVSRYAGMVYATCKRVLGNPHDAEEVAQDCFLQLASGRARIRTSLGGWLHSAATSLALNRVRQDARRRKREETAASAAPQTVEPTWDDVQQHIDEAIAQLPERLRDPLIRHFLQRDTHDQIARDLGLSRTAVTQRIAVGVDRLRKALARKGVTVAAAAFAAFLAAHTAEAAPAALLASLGRLAMTGPAPVSAASSLIAFALKAAVSAALVGALLAAGGYAYIRHELKRPVVAKTSVPVHKETVKPQPPKAPVPPEVKAASGKIEQFPGPPKSPTLDVGVVHGSVLSAQGAPMPGLEVVIERVPNIHSDKKLGDFRLSTATNERGQYEFTHLPLLVDSSFYIFDNKLRLHAVSGETYAALDILAGPIFRDNLACLILYPASAIEGRVTDPLGVPMAKVSVEVQAENGNFRRSDDGFPAPFTDANGDFKAYIRYPGSYSFYAWAPGYTQARALGVPPGSKGVQLQLSQSEPHHAAPGAITGAAVLATTNEPVSGLKLDALTAQRKWLGRATTNSDGSFELAISEPASECLVVVSPISHSRLCVKDGPAKIAMPKDRAPNPIVVSLEEGGTVTGHVIDEATGVHLKGVQVEQETTDSAGMFRLTGLSGETKIALAGRALPACVKTLTVNPGQTIEGVDIVVEKRLRISGVVQDWDGHPLASAAIWLGSTDRRDEFVFQSRIVVPFGSVTNESGQFVMFTPGPTQGLRLQAVHEKGVSRCIGPFDLGNDGLQGLTVTIEPAGRVQGTVVDELGRKVRDSFVVLQPQNPGLAIAFPASNLAGESGMHPDAQGMRTWWGDFALSNVLPGKYTLNAYFKGWTTDAPVAAKTIEVRPGQTVSDIRLVANSRITGAIDGWVTRESLPVEGAAISAGCVDANAFGEGSQSRASTGPDGHFHIDHVPPAQMINVSVSLPDSGLAGQQHVAVAPGKVTTVRFDLQAGPGVVEGTLLVSGTPKSGALIRLEPAVQSLLTEYPTATTDEHGYYQVTGLDPGQYHLTAIVDGDSMEPIAAVEVNVNAVEATRQDINAGGASITVKVKGRTQDENAYLALLPGQIEIKAITRELVETLQPRTLRLMENLVPNLDYHLRGLDAGDYTVVLVAAPPRSSQVPDRFAVSRFATATLTLPENATVTTELALK